MSELESLALGTTGDLDIASGTTRVIKGADCAKQRIKIALDIFLGEWFLDLRVGIPYFRDILVHSPNSETVRSVIRKGIMNTPGIVDVRELTIVLDTAKGKASVDFTAVYENQQEVSGFLALII